jgi:hypothetical protein
LTLYLKEVVGAYNTNPGSVRPGLLLSEDQWAYARVNAFLYAVRTGKFRGGKFDLDLLPRRSPISNMSTIKQTKLFIEKLKNKDESEVVVRIGKFKTKEEAAHYASYICMTKSIDFDAETILDNIAELEENYYGVDNRTLH